VSKLLADPAFAAFTIFCRLGCCLMLLPGFGSARVPMQTRLLVAIALSLAVTPLLLERITASLQQFTEAARPFVLVNEVAIGLLIGLLARLFLLALQFAATVAANGIGLAGIPGQPVEDNEAAPALVTFLSLAATMLLIAAGLHIEMLKAVIASYDVLPMRVGLDAGWIMEQLAAAASETAMLSLRLAAPFIVYAVAVNLAIGLINKFTPQLSVYFVSLGMVTAGGLFVLFLASDDWLSLFAGALSSWIAST
jgi:flagellar biosynthetic protein FliR